MTEKELIKNLSALQSVTADQNWVKKNRDVLSYQIFNGESAAVKLSFFVQFSLLTKRILQPAPIAILIILFFAASGVISIRASRNATPGEPLYIAKAISEKAHFAATFDEKAKARLNLEFASQRAEELEKVASTNTNDPRIEELSANFKQEINSARQRLENLKQAAAKQAAANVATNKQKVDSKATETEEDETVVSAEAGKDDKGLQISTPDTAKALAEVEQLFNQKKYTDAISKLEEIGEQLQ